MNIINLRQLSHIINDKYISFRDKKRLFGTFFLARENAFKSREVNTYQKLEVRTKALIEILKKRNKSSFYIFYDHDTQEPIIDIDPEYYNDRDDTISYDTYCENYISCSRCNDTTHVDDYTIMDSDDRLCQSCYDHVGNYCEDCDTHHYTDSGCSCEDSEDYDTGLRSDQDTPQLHYLGVAEEEEKTTAETQGIEIEMEVRQDFDRYDVVQEIKRIMNKDIERVICVRDGSLCQETGFEMVSTNCTFDYHKNHFWNDFFNSDLVNQLRAYKGSQTAIHIHFTRSAFTEHQQRHLNGFYHNPINKSFLVDVAGRDCPQYAKYCDFINYDSDIVYTGEKYRAINFSKRDTIEVRIFRANIKQISFFRCLELVHSINQFIKTISLDRTDRVSYTEYFDFLLNNPNKDYVNLLLWLDQNEYFDHLQYIEDFKTRYANFKNIVEDFKKDNQELIDQEREERE